LFVSVGVPTWNARCNTDIPKGLVMANPICHWELMVNDVEKAKRFYSTVFGWRFDSSKTAEYTMIDTGQGVGGGMMAKPPGAPSAALNSYFQVDDVEKTLRTVVEAGGAVIVPKTEIPRMGWFAMFLDPDRIPIGVWQEAPGSPRST